MTIDFSALQSLYNDQMNMLLANNGLTTKCLLNYGISKKDLCPNCIYDPNLKKSANTYKTGGPKPFVNGRICPYCNGAGYHGLVKVDEVYLAVIWDYKYWINKPINIQNPTGMIQTICHKSLFDKIKKAKDLTIIYRDTNSNPLFKLAEEPNPVGLGDNNYLICNWERTGISSITESMVARPLVGYNSANYSGPLGNLMMDVGTNGGPSAYGTYDQNGNAEEWTGTRHGTTSPIQIKVGGGYAGSDSDSLLKGGIYGSSESGIRYRGFRVATLSNPNNYNNFVLVDDKYNRNDTNGYGGVNYEYYIGKYEITYQDWCDFINSVATYTTSSDLLTNLNRDVAAPGTLWGNPEITSDTYGLINNSFWSYADYVAPSGFPGNYTFSVSDEYKNKPITNVDWLGALRYCNWLHNGKPSGYQTVNNDGSTPNTETTEGGAYTLNGITTLSSFITNSSSAKYRLPTIDEWYKAAFYKNDPGSTSLPCSTPDAGYWNYATQNNKLPEVKITGISTQDIAMSLTYDTSLDSGNNIVLPLSNPVDIVVDWGDGNISYFNEDGQKEHIYDTEGEYTVNIVGNLNYMNNKLAFTGSGVSIDSHQAKLKSLNSFGNTNLVSMEKFFYGCSNLISVANSIPTGVLSLDDTFAYATNFNHSGIITWNTNNITNLDSTFRYAYDFNQNIDSWNTSNVTNMNELFYSTLSFDYSLNNWNTSQVHNMRAVFAGSIYNSSISGWDTSSVIDMSYMFLGSSFNQDIGGWDTSSVENTSFMFGISSFDQDISNWNLTSLQDAEGMFKSNSSFDQDISGWDVSGVLNMDQMFFGASSFNQNLSSWCVPNISSEPTNFDTDANSWVLSRPIWGTCP